MGNIVCALCHELLKGERRLPESQAAGKPPRLSQVEMTELVLPNDTNTLGNLLGGQLMHWMDVAGGLAASRHSHYVTSTAVVDSLDFRHPVRMGEVVILQSKLTWAGRTSMEVKVSAYAENLKTGHIIQISEAYFVFVALDAEGRPTAVPPLLPETPEEQEEFAQAIRRREERLRK